VIAEGFTATLIHGEYGDVTDVTNKDSEQIWKTLVYSWDIMGYLIFHGIFMRCSLNQRECFPGDFPQSHPLNHTVIAQMFDDQYL